MKNRFNQHGMTLIELVVVTLLILGMVLASIPLFFKLRNNTKGGQEAKESCQKYPEAIRFLL